MVFFLVAVSLKVASDSKSSLEIPLHSALSQGVYFISICVLYFIFFSVGGGYLCFYIVILSMFPCFVCHCMYFVLIVVSVVGLPGVSVDVDGSVGPAECDVADKCSGLVKSQCSSSACPVSLSSSSSHSGLYSMCVIFLGVIWGWSVLLVLFFYFRFLSVWYCP